MIDTLIIGSGIAGLTAALSASKFGLVAIVTKSALRESNTRYAQGGIAAVTANDDSIELHVADTLAAGNGLSDEDAVRILCSQGPARIDELIELGVAFDRKNGELARGREAAHQRSRVLHAGGDATGAHIEAALVDAIRTSDATIYEHTALVDLIVTGGSVKGARFLSGDGARFEIRASAVILATGGAGTMFEHTTNPVVATGDGFAAAFRAGAVVQDAEFFQFHPTAASVQGQTFLISEAVRGEGAVLRDAKGERFMTAIDPRAELAPRDVVARAIAFEMADGPVHLDATALGRSYLAERFPTIDKFFSTVGLDWSSELVPVTPAAHYWMGGIATDTDGRTSIPGLYAVGEVAATGVHGANRLASNSLLEGLVFGRRAVNAIAAGSSSAPTFGEAAALEAKPYVPERGELQRAMWRSAGLLRDRDGLLLMQKTLSARPEDFCASVDRGEWIEDLEDVNLATAASVLVAGALAREESRGAHHRLDFPETTTEWHKHQYFVAQR